MAQGRFLRREISLKSQVFSVSMKSVGNSDHFLSKHRLNFSITNKFTFHENQRIVTCKMQLQRTSLCGLINNKYCTHWGNQPIVHFPRVHLLLSLNSAKHSAADRCSSTLSEYVKMHKDFNLSSLIVGTFDLSTNKYTSKYQFSEKYVTNRCQA